MQSQSNIPHMKTSRRQALQIDGLGLLGLSLPDVLALQSQATARQRAASEKSVLLIYLPGGLSQIDSFDPKPGAPDSTRGEFAPISTRTPGIQICEQGVSTSLS